MRLLLGTTSRHASHYTSRVLPHSLVCLGINRWFPFLSLLVIRPGLTWNYWNCKSTTFPLQRGSTIPFHINPVANMPRITRSRTSSASVLAAKGTSTEEEKSPRKRKVKEDEHTALAEPRKTKATTKTSPAPKKARGSTAKSKIIEESPEEPEGKESKKANSPRKKSEQPAESPKKSRSVRGTTTPVKKDDVLDEGHTGVDEKEAKKPKKKKASDHQRITERDRLQRLWDSQAAANAGSYTFRIASWNVAGLRALMNKYPTALVDLCQEYDLDMLCLQETKLQDSHLDDPKLMLRGCVPGYDDYWSCSKAKKGYSGTAVFIKSRGVQKIKKQANIASFFEKKTKEDSAPATKVTSTQVANVDPELVTPSDVAFHIGKPIDDEGRTIILELPFATITNVYVPNSGQTLERLDYRTKEWDKDFLAFQQKKEKDRDLPVIWLGDLNIAHKAFDVWNDGATHLAKQAGVTEQERLSFQEQLDAGFVDAFRKLHPLAKGHYSYWSQRAGNREPNKGLRLDYFICSPGLFAEDSPAVVRDSYMVPDRLGSDHSPVVLEIELKAKKSI